MQTSTRDQLRQIVEQIERLDDERKGIADDIRDKFAEAKAFGFDVKALRTVLRLRRKSQSERQEDDAILATYMTALGMVPFDADGLGKYARDNDQSDMRDTRASA